MSTHGIGAGKVNITTTFDEVEARAIGRVAFLSGMRSRNAWVRKIIMEAVQRAQMIDCGKLAGDIGRHAILLLCLGAVGWAIASEFDLRRLPGRLVRNSRREWMIEGAA